jgi:hypothetical protein
MREKDGDSREGDASAEAARGSGKRMHTAPRFILAGFAEPRDSKGTLWSFDLVDGTYRESSPRNLAVKKSFYRLDEGGADRDMLDDAFQKNEAVIAPILRGIEEEDRFPSEEELGEIIWFVATLHTRTEGFRRRFTQMAEWEANSKLDFYLSSREHWEYRIARREVPDGVTYEEVVRMREEGWLNLRLRRDVALLKTVEAADRTFEVLKGLRWTMLHPDASLGPFISSDSPVLAAKEWSVAFSSRLAFVAHESGREGQLVVRRGHIAEMNSSTALAADRFLFSGRREVLCNLDRLGPWLPHLPDHVHATQRDHE